MSKRIKPQLNENQVKDTKSTLKRVWSYLKKYRGKLIIVIFFIIFAIIFSTITTLLLQPTIDNYVMPLMNSNTINVDGLLKQLILLTTCSLLGAIGLYLQYYMMIKISASVVKDMRNDLFKKLQKLPVRYYDENTYGELMSRIVNDLDNVNNSLNTTIDQTIAGVLNIIISLILMLSISPALTLVVILSVPIMLISSMFIMKRTAKQFKIQQECLGDLNGYIEEYITGQKVIKAFNYESETKKGFNKYNQKLRKEGFKANAYSGAIMPLTSTINSICSAVIYVVAGMLIIKGNMTIGLVLAFVKMRSSFTNPISEIAQNIPIVQSGLAGAERMFEIMDEEEEFVDALDKPDLTNVKGLVEFRNVSFAYNKKLVLKDVSFTAKPGEIIAIVGPTGAGKTTIINLLTRFYDTSNGEILIDGKNIKDVNVWSLRQSLGIVLQETVLFSDTVKENIRYGKLDAKDKAVKEAAIMSKADNFITKLPKKYNTILNEETSNISVGQKQLLNISRVILNNPKILILDEATSNVDTRTEVQIREAMEKLMNGRTCFVIAHRLSTIRNADKILVINDGELVESGTHKELIKRHGIYYEMYTGMFDMK